MWNLVDIYTEQLIFNAWHGERNIDFECFLSICGRSRRGVAHCPPPIAPSELIFGKAGFSVVWGLLKK